MIHRPKKVTEKWSHQITFLTYNTFLNSCCDGGSIICQRHMQGSQFLKKISHCFLEGLGSTRHKSGIPENSTARSLLSQWTWRGWGQVTVAYKSSITNNKQKIHDSVAHVNSGPVLKYEPETVNHITSCIFLNQEMNALSLLGPKIYNQLLQKLRIYL